MTKTDTATEAGSDRALRIFIEAHAAPVLAGALRLVADMMQNPEYCRASGRIVGPGVVRYFEESAVGALKATFESIVSGEGDDASISEALRAFEDGFRQFCQDLIDVRHDLAPHTSRTGAAALAWDEWERRVRQMSLDYSFIRNDERFSALFATPLAPDWSALPERPTGF